MVCDEDHFTKDYLHLMEVHEYVKVRASQPEVLKNPLPPQQQKMVSTNPMPLQGGKSSHPNMRVDHMREMCSWLIK